MNYIRNWQRFVACSCSHGEMIKPSARYELLTWCDQYKPHTTLHLGDFMDTTAFIRSASCTADAPIAPDIEAGTRFLKDFHAFGSRKHYTFCGNHEDRLWRLSTDRREMVAFAAQTIIQHIKTTCDLLDSPLYEYTEGQMWRLLGDTYFGHGIMFNMQAARDHAEMLGRSVVFGHTHQIKESPARTNHRAIGYNIGWLGDRKMADYAKARRNTASWQNGFAYGEYCDDECRVTIYRCREERHEEERIG